MTGHHKGSLSLIHPRTAHSVIGLDIAKSIFQVHAVDAMGAVIERRTLQRARVLSYFQKLSPCVVGMEAGATGHFWGRELGRLGHQVRLIAPAFVRPFVRGDKTDARDAEAICEAIQRPYMQFVPIKSVEAQAAVTLHRARELLVKQRTQLLNMLRSLFAEFGVSFVRGVAPVFKHIDRLASGELMDLPDLATETILSLGSHAKSVSAEIQFIENRIRRWHEENAVSQLLATIPGVGLIGATALASWAVEPERFNSARQFSAWLGLTPMQRSSGSRVRYGRISRRGNAYIRRLLVLGSMSIVLQARRNPARADSRLVSLLERRPFKVVLVAMANRNARIAWAVMTKLEAYRPMPLHSLADVI